MDKWAAALDKLLKPIIALAVTFVWVVVELVDAFSSSFSAPIPITILMGSVATAVLGIQLVKTNGADKSKKEGSDDANP